MSNNNYHHGDVRNSIISAGIDIITEDGAQSLTIRNAAKKIGVSHTAPYRHFKNKEELLVAIAIKGFDLLEQEINNASALVEIGRAYIQFAISNSNYYRVMFGDSIRNKTDYPEFFKAYDRSFRRLIQVIGNSGNKQGSDKTDLEITAVAVWSLLHGYCLLIIDNEKDKAVGSNGQIERILLKLAGLLE